jgi:exosortase/archaeosortase family protein
VAEADDEARTTAAPASKSWTRFALLFGAIAVAGELAYVTVVVSSEPFGDYLRVLARCAGALLAGLAQDVRVDGSRLVGADFDVRVADGCDAFQICTLFAAAVIAFPVSVARRLRALGAGLLWLQGLNLARIVSLFWIAAHHTQVFMTFHLVIWPLTLIALTVSSWVAWALWETRDGPSRAD